MSGGNKFDPRTSRRSLIVAAGAAAMAWPLGAAFAQDGAPPAAGAGPAGAPPRRPAGPPPTPEQIAAQLPIRTTGLEHVSMQIPDVQEAGVFYGKVFNPALHKEKDLPLRYYVPLTLGSTSGPLHYIAIGAAGERPTRIDHYCTLVEDYNAPAMNARLKQEGIVIAGRVPMYPDPDGLLLQLLGAPGGLAKTTEAATPISTDPPIFEPLGLDNVIMQVSDLDRATAFYTKLFNGKVTRDGDRVWLQVVNTRLGLMTAPAGAKPGISSFCVNVKPFRRAEATRKLVALGGQIVPTAKADGDILRFKSPMGIVVDVKGVKS